MKTICAVCLLIISFTGCKDNHPSLAGDEPVQAKDFIAAFKKIKLPFKIADTNFVKMEDTTTISYKVFSQFVPDSSLQKLFEKNAPKMIIKPVARIEEEKEIYLLANFSQNKKTRLAVFVFDKKNKFLSSMELLSTNNDNYLHTVSITNEPTFIINREKNNVAGEQQYTKNGYGFSNSAGDFINVMNDSNEGQNSNNDIINPIDTLPRKNKYSTDYAKDKKNFISLRDGKDAMHYTFFIHFEKDGGQCTGILKGTMNMRDNSKGYYQESGDPCVIDFSFGGNNIVVKEQGNCGNHRGIKCYFDDTYHKKKEIKTSKKK